MSILTIKTYRYEFSAEIMALIAEFARNHQFDDRKIYKENWLSWTKTNADLVETELSRVMRLGYSGNIADKMFKAGRYYFREKKSTPNVNDTENIECNITVLLESLLNPTNKKTAKLYGYYRQNKWPEYNPNFKKHNFTRKRMPNFSYYNINKKQKLLKQTQNLTGCKLSKMRNHNNGLKEYYYLYVFIKYVQLFLNTTNYDDKQYGDFFGSYSKQEMIDIIS